MTDTDAYIAAVLAVTCVVCLVACLVVAGVARWRS